MATKAQVYRLPDAGARHLNDIDDEYLACKAARRHNMPKMLPGKIPAGVTVSVVRRGIFQVTGTCRDCGLPGTLTTARGGVIGTGWVYDYTALKGSSAFNGYLAPKGAGLTTADYREEYSNRVIETIKAAAAPAARSTARPAAGKQTGGKPASKSQASHASNPRARRHARDGERHMEADRQRRNLPQPGSQPPQAGFSGEITPGSTA